MKVELEYEKMLCDDKRYLINRALWEKEYLMKSIPVHGCLWDLYGGKQCCFWHIAMQSDK